MRLLSETVSPAQARSFWSLIMTTIDYSKFEGHTPGLQVAAYAAVLDPFEKYAVKVGPKTISCGIVNEADAQLFAAAPTLLARCKALEEALRQSEKFIRDYLRDSGGCDHSVGICECETVRLLDSVIFALAATP